MMILVAYRIFKINKIEMKISNIISWNLEKLLLILKYQI